MQVNDPANEFARSLAKVLVKREGASSEPLTVLGVHGHGQPLTE